MTTTARKVLEASKFTHTMKISMRSTLMELAPEDKVNEIIAKLSTDEALDKYAAVFSELYTEEELTALVEWYQTPLGRKSTTLMPVIMQQANIVTQEILSDLEV